MCAVNRKFVIGVLGCLCVLALLVFTVPLPIPTSSLGHRLADFASSSEPDFLSLVPPSNQTTLVVLVIPTGTNRTERDVMRATWLSYGNVYHRTLRPDASFRLFFIIGAQNYSTFERELLGREQQQMGDMWVSTEYPAEVTGTKFMGFLHWLVMESRLNFQYLLKVDTDTFLRTELFESYVVRRVLEPKRGSVAYGMNNTFHGHVCGLDKNISYNAGACYLMSRDIVLWWVLSSGLQPAIKWCSDLEDVRAGLWLSLYAEAHPLTWVAGEFRQLALEFYRSNEQRLHPLVFHYYQLKENTEKYHRYLFNVFPPGSNFSVGFQWEPWMDMLIADEIRRFLRLGYPRDADQKGWLRYQLRVRRQGVVVVGMCPNNTLPDLKGFWREVFSLIFPDDSLAFFDLPGAGVFRETVSFNFVICEGFSYDFGALRSAFNNSSPTPAPGLWDFLPQRLGLPKPIIIPLPDGTLPFYQWHQLPYTIAHNPTLPTGNCSVDLVVAGSRVSNASCPTLYVPQSAFERRTNDAVQNFVASFKAVLAAAGQLGKSHA